jgi:hypothetical protein
MGVARGNAWPLYCDAMTDPNPDERPSFLARLAIVATIGIVILQIGLGVAVGMDAKRGGMWIPRTGYALFFSRQFRFLQSLVFITYSKASRRQTLRRFSPSNLRLYGNGR